MWNRYNKMSSFDNRKIERFELEIPAFLKLKNGKHNGAIEHKTKNISSKGAFIYVEEPISVGSDVNVDLILPNNSKIKVDGTVIRSDQKGIAVCFDTNYQIFPQNA